MPLRIFADERGEVMHMLRADAPHFAGFGEIYFSSVRCRMVKGWKRHRQMTLNFAVPVGQVRLILFDDRNDSPSNAQKQELLLGRDPYELVIVPPGIWAAFQGVSQETSLVANCASLPHDPTEADVRPLSDPPTTVAW